MKVSIQINKTSKGYEAEITIDGRRQAITKAGHTAIADTCDAFATVLVNVLSADDAIRILRDKERFNDNV